jgi:hypothetical protein
MVLRRPGAIRSTVKIETLTESQAFQAGIAPRLMTSALTGDAPPAWHAGEMRISEQGGATLVIELSRAELVILTNALNETCSGVSELDDDNEFATRLGAPRDVCRRLLAEANDAAGNQASG